MKLKNSVTTLGAGFAAALMAAFAQAEDVTVVWDTSNSMWGQIDGESKIEIARRVMAETVGEWVASGADVGLVAYGHRRSGDCSDIETILPVGPLDPDTFLEAINGLTPRGMTPLSDAVRHAAEEMRSTERAATVVLISDGIESCDADPCAVAAELAEMGVDFRVHVVGFDVAGVAAPSDLQCIADNTGGRFFTADTADELSAALVQAAQAFQPEPEPDPQPEPQPEPEPEPEPDPESAMPDTNVGLEAPEAAVIGSVFTVRWENAVEPRDFVTIVPLDADQGVYAGFVRVGDNDEGTLTAPAEPGFYEVRYLLNEGRRTAASTTVEVVTQDVSVTAPESVATGSTFTVSWDGAINDRDYVTIVPLDADEGVYGGFVRVGGADGSGSLTAPAEPGFYEVRYLLNEGRRTMASTAVEVVTQDVSVAAPESVATGSTFTVSWDGAINDRDYVTIVPLDADEGVYGGFVRVGGADGLGSLTAPSEPGFYDVRYILNEGRRTMASTVVEVVTQEVSVTAPDEAVAGETFTVSWDGAINDRDYVTIVPLGADEGVYGGFVRVGGADSGALTAPLEPGFYEVRYVLNEGRRTLASTPVEIVAVTADITAPEGVVAEAPFSVGWQGPARRNDRILLVAMGAGPESPIAERAVPSDGADIRFDPLSETGPYDLIYVLGADQTVIARTTFEVDRVEARLEAPPTARAGGVVEIEWSGPGNDRDRIAIAEPDMPAMQWLDAVAATGGEAVALPVPDAAGSYEIRYFDFENRAILVRRPITVE